MNTPNVLYVTVDSLRKDRVHADTMPYLAGLADDGIWFDEMYSTAPATAASFVGLIASRYYADVDGIGLPENEFSTLLEAAPDEYTTMGYSTNQFTSSYYNYDRGADTYTGPDEGIKWLVRKHLDETGRLFRLLEWGYQRWLEFGSNTTGSAPTHYSPPAGTVNETVNRWIREADGPWFAWMHYMDPHHPYEPPDSYLPADVPDRGTAQRLTRELPGKVPQTRKDDLETATRLYDAECRYWDDEFKQFHQQLPEDTLVVVVGDHGELLGEHSRLGHPHAMWRELTNVPCLVYHPSLSPATVESRQSTIDLAPTLLDLVGTSTPSDMRGSPIDISDPEPREYAYGTIETPEHVGMVRGDDWSWLRHNSRRSTQPSPGDLLLAADAEENCADGQYTHDQHPGVARDHRDRYDAEMARRDTADARSADSEAVQKHLADLGYLDQQ